MARIRPSSLSAKLAEDRQTAWDGDLLSGSSRYGKVARHMNDAAFGDIAAIIHKRLKG